MNCTNVAECYLDFQKLMRKNKKYFIRILPALGRESRQIHDPVEGP